LVGKENTPSKTPIKTICFLTQNAEIDFKTIFQSPAWNFTDCHFQIGTEALNATMTCPECTPETIIEDKLLGQFHEVTEQWIYCHRHETFWAVENLTGLRRPWKYADYRFIPDPLSLWE
jgi:hypothetical protein